MKTMRHQANTDSTKSRSKERAPFNRLGGEKKAYRQYRFGAALLLATTFFSSPSMAQTSASDHTYATRYDAAGRVVGTIAPDPDGSGSLKYAASRTTYNAQGFVTKVESGYLTTWKSESIAPSSWGADFKPLSRVETDYDTGGRKVEERSYGVNSSGTSTLIARTNFSYDDVGRLECTARRMNLSATPPSSACTLGTEGSDGPDRITKSVYDAAGQVTKVQRAVGTPLQQNYVQYTYDDNGQKLTVTDANGNKALYAYDGHDRLEYWYMPSKTTPGVHSTSDYEQYGYDANGNMTSKRTRRGITISYTYDALNRMTVKDMPYVAGIITDRRRDVYYGYDLQGLQLYARHWGPESTREGLTTTYDGLGRMASNALLMDGVTRTIGYQHNKNGARTRVTYDNGVWFQYRLDGLDRVTGLYQSDTYKFRDYAYDQRGNVSGYTTNTTNHHTDYLYDTAGRISSLAHDTLNTNEDVTWTFAYNPASQTKQETLSNTAYKWAGFANDNVPYVVNGLNQYTTVDGATFTYDGAGNLTSDGVTTYTYDIENRLITATGAGKNVDLEYDAMGRLYQVNDLANSTITRFLWDGDELVAEFNSAGTATRRHLHGAGVDDPVASFDCTTYSYSCMSYLMADRQGSIVGLANSSGDVTDKNAYDSYGVPKSPTSANPMVGRFGYTGQAWIPELGLWHYKARFYSPTLGRFMQTDPIGYEDQVNLYAYVGNDPVNLVDPSGRDSIHVRMKDGSILRILPVNFSGDANTPEARAKFKADVESTFSFTHNGQSVRTVVVEGDRFGTGNDVSLNSAPQSSGPNNGHSNAGGNSAYIFMGDLTQTEIRQDGGGKSFSYDGQAAMAHEGGHLLGFGQTGTENTQGTDVMGGCNCFTLTDDQKSQYLSGISTSSGHVQKTKEEDFLDGELEF